MPFVDILIYNVVYALAHMQKYPIRWFADNSCALIKCTLKLKILFKLFFILFFSKNRVYPQYNITGIERRKE